MSFSVLVNGQRVKLCSRVLVYLSIRRRMACAALAAAKQGIEAALVDEVTARLGRGRYELRFLSKSGETGWTCNGCGTTLGREFARDGTYTRNLAFRLGLLAGLVVPRVECGSKVRTSFDVLEKHRRFWYGAAFLRAGGEP